MTKVEIRACISDVGGSTRPAIKGQQPHFFGVYIGEPGNMRWTADFFYHQDALNWATEVAENHECPLEDACES